MRMKWVKSKSIAILFLLALTPGFLTILYSRTYIVSGIGATSFFWQHASYGETVHLNVSSSVPNATKTIPGQRLLISSFNTSGTVVSIDVTSDNNGTILEHTTVSGQQIEGITFPQDEPSGWVIDQNFNVTVFWEGENASVSFYYSTEIVGHTDGSVTYIRPGFYEVQNFGLILLGGGLVLYSLYTIIVVIRSHVRNESEP